ncbi:hypothetical protein ACHAW6_015847 [Cyclotella cf. meneghiniana]
MQGQQVKLNMPSPQNKTVVCMPSSGPSKCQTKRKRISLIETSKWTIFVLLVTSLRKFEMEEQATSYFTNHIRTHTTVDITSARPDPLPNSTTTASPSNRTHTYNDQKIVLLPGPHKSASTSVQRYLVRLAIAGILPQYNWEWIGKDSSKGFSDLAQHLLYEAKVGENDRKLLMQKNVAQDKWYEGKSLVIAAEFMDYIAALPEEQARASIERLFDWLPRSTTQTNTVETVVMYRSPRASHLVSVWKQQVQFHKASSNLPWRESLDERHRPRRKFPTSPTLAEWLCYGKYPQAMKYDILTILSAQLNPFGVAYTYHKYGGSDVTIVDMMGVPDSDIPSSVVCNVLRLPCTPEGKLAVNSEVVSSQENHKSETAGLGMSSDHLKEAEIILRDMDCYYYCLLGESVHVLHASDEVFAAGKNSWEKCCQRNKAKKLEQSDGKWMAQQLVQLGCRALEESPSADVLSNQVGQTGLP